MGVIANGLRSKDAAGINAATNQIIAMLEMDGYSAKGYEQDLCDYVTGYACKLNASKTDNEIEAAVYENVLKIFSANPAGLKDLNKLFVFGGCNLNVRYVANTTLLTDSTSMQVGGDYILPPTSTQTQGIISAKENAAIDKLAGLNGATPAPSKKNNGLIILIVLLVLLALAYWYFKIRNK